MTVPAADPAPRAVARQAPGFPADGATTGSPAAVVESPTVTPARAFPAALLRVVLAASAVAALVTALVPIPGLPGWSAAWIALAVCAIATAAAPGTVAPTIFLIGIVVARASAPSAGVASLAVLAPLVLVVHQAAALCAVIPLRSRCHWRAVWPTVRRGVVSVAAVEAALAVYCLAGG